MKIFSLATVALFGVANAVMIKNLLSHGDEYGYDHDCDDDNDYFCPPALEKCPGVLQPPGPCKTALDARPLCYSNEGYMHTDWDHHVKVDDDGCYN